MSICESIKRKKSIGNIISSVLFAFIIVCVFGCVSGQLIMGLILVAISYSDSVSLEFIFTFMLSGVLIIIIPWFIAFFMYKAGEGQDTRMFI